MHAGCNCSSQSQWLRRAERWRGGLLSLHTIHQSHIQFGRILSSLHAANASVSFARWRTPTPAQSCNIIIQLTRATISICVYINTINQFIIAAPLGRPTERTTNHPTQHSPNPLGLRWSVQQRTLRATGSGPNPSRVNYTKPWNSYCVVTCVYGVVFGSIGMLDFHLIILMWNRFNECQIILNVHNPFLLSLFAHANHQLRCNTQTLN